MTTYMFSVECNTDLEEYYLTVSPDLDPKSAEEALDLSIKKWEFIVDWLENNPNLYLEDGGGYTCSLCKFYGYCPDCPVYDITHSGCDNTPFGGYRDSGSYNESLCAAKDELAFLEGLRKVLQCG